MSGSGRMALAAGSLGLVWAIAGCAGSDGDLELLREDAMADVALPGATRTLRLETEGHAASAFAGKQQVAEIMQVFEPDHGTGLAALTRSALGVARDAGWRLERTSQHPDAGMEGVKQAATTTGRLILRINSLQGDGDLNEAVAIVLSP